MNRILTLCLAFLSPLLFSAELAIAQEENAAVWGHSYEQAVKNARTSGRPVLLHFYSDACLPCQMMERNVLNQPEVVGGLQGKFVSVKIDSQARQDLVQKYGVQLLPSDVFVDPQGRILASVTGFREAKDYVALTSSIESRFTESQRVRKAQEIARKQLATTKKLDDKGVVKVSRAKVDKPALDGYSPVELQKNRTWTLGKSTLTAEHKGQTYHFLSEEERTSFLENPAKYSPRLLGCDPVTMWESDRAISGATEFGAYFNGDLYLFTSAENRQLFKIDPSRYTRTRHVLQTDDIDTGTVIK